MKVLETKPVKYHLCEMKAEKIHVGFYECELPKFKTTGMCQIEKILKTRNCKRKRKLLVCWLGYTSDFVSWIASEDIHNT